MISKFFESLMGRDAAGIRLSFLGAAGGVTGSKFLLEAAGQRWLIDCGYFQERQFTERNWDPFPIPLSELDGVLLTHAHLDHCGLLPKLVREGFKGRIYATGATAEIASIVMLDSAHIQVEDAEYKKKRHARSGHVPPRPVQPLYEPPDAEVAAELFVPVKYDTIVELAPGLQATFHDAGHILGSAMIMVNVESNGTRRNILFSGDIGRPDVPILRDPTLFEQADYVLCESTYGDRVHEDNADIKENFAQIINETEASGGNLIIPSFAVERSQEVLYYLNELLAEKRIPNLLTFLDSPMAVRVTEVFRRHPQMFDRQMREYVVNGNSPFSFDGLVMTPMTQQSKAINEISGTCIIIAGSGMCTGGRVKHHLVNNISREACTVLFVGYQAVGTLGRGILDKPERIRILGEKREVKARIERLYGFSGHADRNEILDWLSAIKKKPRQLFLVHGEPDAAGALADAVRDTLNWEVTVPEYLQTVDLD